MPRHSRRAVARLAAGIAGGILVALTPSWKPALALTGTPQAAPASVTKTSPPPSVGRPLSRVGISPTSDVLVQGEGDADGYHLFVADAAHPASWMGLATIDPAPAVDDGWIGQQCLTTDGRYLAVTVAPRGAAHRPDLMAHGGFAYSVDVTSGAVHALVTGVTLAYFSPSCGSTEAVFTSFDSSDDSPSTIIKVNLATGAREATFHLPGEVTSATPLTDGSVLAVEGTHLIDLVAGRSPRAIASPVGQAFDLRPNAGGGVDFLITGAGDTAAVARWLPSAGMALLGHGPLHATRLFSGRGGTTAVVGATADRGSVPPGMRWLAEREPQSVAALSLNLDDALIEHGEQKDVARVADTSGTSTPVTLPSAPPATSASLAPAVTASSTASVPNQTTPSCAVPRNDVHSQIAQPSYAQVDWAVQEITRSVLISARFGDPTWNLSAYYPSLDFPLGGVTVPREVMSGIIAAESNWQQASWHAIPGVAGNPLVADYYGWNGTTWDYNNADCGYGLTQRTDGMHVGDTQFSTNVQRAVGLDYVENVAAGAATLVSKWNQLQSLGIIANNGSTSDLENWYFAIWAYNSGIHPDDGSGNSGLGWANNPINPAFPPNRAPYRTVTTADSSHPGDWPYQEQVIGWMEVPLTSNGGVTAYQASAKYLELPDHALFCNASDSCNSATTSQPCTLSNPGSTQYHCWWHHPASWGDACSQNCTPATWSLTTTASEPTTPTNPYPPVCSLASSSSPAPSAGALIVDEEADGVLTDQHMSVNSGCSSNPGWSSSGSFSLTLGANAPIDFHQLGVGFDGHIWFTHEVAQSDARDLVSATWTPAIPAAGGGYNVWVFVPSDGATATDAQYTINDGRGNQYKPLAVNQNAYSNAWVSLGNFPLAPGTTLSLTNSNANGATADDLAFNAVAFELTSPGLQSQYVAMGDSYSSGQGDPPFTNDSSDGCNRSVEGYPIKLVNPDSTIYRGQLAFVACSGATTTDVLQGRDGEPAQTTWLSASTQLATITIGGNDVGFGPILRGCVTFGPCGSSGYPTLDAQIQAMQPKLRSLYGRLVVAAPNAQIVVLTYPQILPPNGAGCNPTVTGNMSSDDISWAYQEWDKFDTVIKQAALGVPHVQVLDEEHAFDGHSACDTVPYANGIIATATNNSFHPNWRGDQQMASDLETLLHLP